jgi:MFS transporter, PAT family, beta-lactamase induction signal transducer AmpG
LFMGAAFAAIGLTLPLDGYVRWTLIVFWLIAFSSATHDIAADGFYMLGLDSHGQSFFVGIRNTFWRIAAISAQGGLVFLSGILANRYGSLKTAWIITFTATGIVYFFIGIYHKAILPKPLTDTNQDAVSLHDGLKKYLHTFLSFFTRSKVWIFVLFILLYRLGEAQLGKMSAPFMLDSKEVGGLGLDNEQVGFAYGTMGVIGLIAGGILGGIVVSCQGLKFWLWPMALAMNLPDIFYIYLAKYQPEDFNIILSVITIEQFGYGFGFVAFTLYMIYFVQGENRTSHFAFATGIMALGMMVPGMLSGWIQEMVNYENFFIWVTLCTLPGMAIIPFLKIDKTFGKKAPGSSDYGSSAFRKIFKFLFLLKKLF